MHLPRTYAVLTLTLSLVLTGCAAFRESSPLAPEAAARGVKVVREVPSKLPSEVSPVTDTQYLLVFSQSAAVVLLDSVNPIPLSVAQTVTGVYEDQEAKGLKDRYAAVDPYDIAVQAMRGSPLLTGRGDALPMTPLVYLVEDASGVFRATLVFRVEDDAWLGRYMYHMPDTYSGAQLKGAGAEVLQSLKRDLEQGAGILRSLMERDARGEFRGGGRRVKYGSYHLVGSPVAGMVSASIYAFPDAQVLEEDADHVVLRSGGKPTDGARKGALAFGVHYFRKDQLHTFKSAGNP